MNSYSLAADSRSWWLPSSVVGGLAAITLGAILVLSNTGEPAPVSNAPDAPAASVPDDRGNVGQCFMQRPPRNHGGDELPVPACR